MTMQIKAGETDADRLKVPGYALLLSSGIDPATGENGTPNISINGGASAASNAVAEIDATNQPGDYYFSLDATDVAAGNLGARIVPNLLTGTANFVWPIIEVVADDSADAVANLVWDEPLTGASHNVVASAGRRLRTLPGPANEGTAQGPGPNGNHIVLESGASAVSGSYDPALVTLTGGTGEGQTRLILEYDGPNRTATVDRTWRVIPDNTSEYSILPVAGRNSVNEGRLQAGTSTTATLNADASAVNDSYNGQILFLRSGVGEDQVRYIIAYNGTTKVATVNEAFETTPDGNTGYMIMPNVATAQQPAGLNTVMLTIHDQDANPVPGVVVDIYDSGDTRVIGRATDDDLNGIVTFALNDGSYLVRAVTTGFQLDTIPQPLTVSGTTAETFDGTLFVAPASVDPALCTVYGTLFDTSGNEWNSERLSFYTVDDGIPDANVLGNKIAEVITGPAGGFAAGQFQVELPREASVLCVTRALGTPGSKFSVTADIPDAASATFDSIYRP